MRSTFEACCAALALLAVACERKALPSDRDAAAILPPPAAIVDASVVPARLPTILVIGDSHTYGNFGHRLHERLAGLGRFAVVSEAAGGATPETYLEERPQALYGYRVRESARGEHLVTMRVDQVRAPMDSLGTLLARHDPTVVVVALGTNRPRASVEESTDAILRRIGSRRVIWIGPPAVERGAPALASLRAAVESHAQVTFLDSSTFNAARPLPAENPHFGPDDAGRWADTTFAKMEPLLGE